MSRRTTLFIILLAIISLDIYLLNIPKGKKTSSTPSSTATEVVTPIHMRLNNQMSEFEQTQAFDRGVENFMRRWGLTGGSFALMRNDSLLYAKGYGYANLQDSVKCEVNNVFRIASASKLITATAIMKLIEQNKLSLHSQVFGENGVLCDSMFLDLRNKNLEKITVEHLLRHTAGFSAPLGDVAFPNPAVAKAISDHLPLTVDDLVQYATRNRLRANPGDRYSYSNLGYIILGKVIEKTTNMSYENYVQDSILDVAGCYDMYIGQSFKENRDYNEVCYYEVKEAEPVEAYDGSGRMEMKSNGGNNIQLLGAAGGWVASPVELLKLVSTINNDTTREDILSHKSIYQMTQESDDFKPMGWAAIESDQWFRSGSMSGTATLIKRQRDGYTWVFVTNSSTWVSFHLSDYMSTHFSNAIAKVKGWPKRDLFSSQDCVDQH